MAKSAATLKKQRELEENPDALLDDVLGTEADTPDDDYIQDDDDDDTEEDEEDDTSDDEDDVTNTEDGEDILDDDDSGEPPADEDDDEGEVGDEDEGDDENQGSESESEPPAAKKGKKDPQQGLLKELRETRQKNAELQAQLAARPPTAPPPGDTTAAPVDQPNNQIPVTVSEDGKQVYVDFDNPDVQRIIANQSRAANAPTPQELKQQALAGAMRDFAAEEAGNSSIVERANEIDDFVSANVESLMMRGLRPQTIGQVVQALEDAGVGQRVAEAYPEMEGMFPEFVEAMSSGNPTWRTSMYRRMKSAAAAPPAPSRDESRPNIPRPKSPRSLARKGGRRSEGGTADEKEYDALQSRFKDDFMLMPEDKWNRMQELGVKLGKPGYE